MRVWRVCRKAYAADPLSGRGGLFTSGRWHSKGRRIVYSSASVALAALEYLVHVGQDEVPPDLNQIEIDVPDDVEIERVDAAALPPGWRGYPAPEKLQQVGNEWLDQQRTLVLQVPSAVIPKESNYLLNPGHGEAHRLAVISTQGFVFGSRRAPKSR